MTVELWLLSSHTGSHSQSHLATQYAISNQTKKTDSTQINLNTQSSGNPRSTSNQSSKPCTVLQYPSRRARYSIYHIKHDMVHWVQSHDVVNWVGFSVLLQPHDMYGKLSSELTYSTYNIKQGALATNKNAVIPQWALGLRNRRITVIPQICSESPSTEIQHSGMFSGTTFSCFQDIKQFGCKPAFITKRMLFVKAGLHLNCLISWKQGKVVPLIIAECWISVLQDSERICGITVIRRFRNHTAHYGITAFSLQVARAPCQMGIDLILAKFETSCDCTQFTILIQRNLPPWGGFLFTMFSGQVPGGRGLPSKTLY